VTGDGVNNVWHIAQPILSPIREHRAIIGHA